MRFFTLEHSKAAYQADFAIYGTVVAVLVSLLIFAAPHELWLEFSVLAVMGLLSWTAIEYVLHRFFLHGVQPFKRWHQEHHQRPRALICTPTILSTSLMTVLVFLPAFVVSGFWGGCALTAGMLIGYLIYAITHHAIHHWQSDNAWLKRRKDWHLRHHHGHDSHGYFGVTSNFWDYVFGSSDRSSLRPDH